MGRGRPAWQVRRTFTGPGRAPSRRLAAGPGRAALISLATLISLASLVTSCSTSSGRTSSNQRSWPKGQAPLPATSPYLAMTAGGTGWAVWPSGSTWLLLATSDGFSHVTNRTPVGVETSGGLVGAFSPGAVAVAIAAHERLLSSPLLTGTATSSSATWVPVELPGAVADSRGAVSLGAASPGAGTPGAVAPGAGNRTAVMNADGGEVVMRTTSGWSTLTTGHSLAAGGGLTIDSITWASPTLGWVTGHGTVGTAMAFQTRDGGKVWTPVAAGGGSKASGSATGGSATGGSATGGSIAALAPCGGGAVWALPVIGADGTIAVLRTIDGGSSWSRGARLPVATGAPAWGCNGSDLWLAGSVGKTGHVFSSANSGQTWADQGRTPAGLSDLSPAGGGTGFAASGGKHPTLWAVTGNGAHFRPITLPGWVAALGEQLGTD